MIIWTTAWRKSFVFLHLGERSSSPTAGLISSVGITAGFIPNQKIAFLSIEDIDILRPFQKCSRTFPNLAPLQLKKHKHSILRLKAY